MPGTRPTSTQAYRNRTLAVRHRQDELMDDPGLDSQAHADALRGLARLNRAAFIEHSVYRALEPDFIQHRGDTPLRVLDVAAGSGDLIAALARRSVCAGVTAHFTGCDISPFACDHIDRRASNLPDRIGDRIDSCRCDVLNEPLPTGYDIVMCHLFLHHLDEPDIVRLLRSMRESARVGVLITDLRRTRRGYALAWLGSRLLTRSRVVHTDALRSVRGALSMNELRTMAIDAGYDADCIHPAWPQRTRLQWRA